MGGALIGLVRGRYAPSRVSTAWAMASHPTGSERFAREVSLRWERAAAELEELIRARGWAHVREDQAETAEPERVAAAAASLDRGATAPRVREVDPSRTDPARRIRSSADRRDAGAGRSATKPLEFPGARHGARSPSGHPGVEASRRARAAGAPAPRLDPGSSRREPEDDPMPLEALGRLESGPWAPWRRDPAAPAGDATAVPAALPTRGGDVLDLARVPAGSGVPLEEPRSRRREAGASSSGAGAPDRAGHGFPGWSEDAFRDRSRDGGPTAPAAASEQSRSRGARPGPRLDLLVEEARRQAEALEDWERTEF